MASSTPVALPLVTDDAAPTVLRIGFLGPAGTFTEQALLGQTDLASQELVPMSTIAEVLAAADSGEIDFGFVGIENSIEGTVNVTIDALAFEHDLLIQREVELGIQLHLLAPPGVGLADLTRVLTFPVAMGQCRAWLGQHLPSVELAASNSNAEAARLVAVEADGHSAAIAPAHAAEIYGLDVLAEDIEDHPENTTRFVLVGKNVVPPATGHDKTTIVVLQRTDQPGSLLAILQEFAARAINLVKLESRPTKKGLGHYCFIIDLEGHLSDELVADCLRDVRSKVEDIKYLGSYPAAGVNGPAVRREAEAAWRSADAWIQDQRSKLQG
ncbi:MAG: prephenate dehydratase [Acidimicrobiia bacterium]|nr:prephenate dehydratase [Acidimicrobiia bacterium]